MKVSVKDGKVMVGNAHVTTADAAASNGAVHFIDKVMMPK
ncbi:MAG: fasciclin domain-containing protein [Thermonemataceae bacterium]|nr:fasciclin domain-containing protein [Thermonemataceae bacterium]